MSDKLAARLNPESEDNMSTQAQHTPLPWEPVSRNRLLAYGRGPGFDIMGSADRNLEHQEVVADKLTEADAEFTCRAANSYYKLLDACGRARNFMLSSGGDLAKCSCVDMLQNAIDEATQEATQ